MYTSKSRSGPAMSETLDFKKTLNFIKTDFSATLFPLKTNLLVAERYGAELQKHIRDYVLNKEETSHAFLPQQRVYATKPRGHLRRTAKFDPVAEYYLYSVCSRNRTVFRPQISNKRRSFGYRFAKDSPIPVHTAFQEYKKALRELPVYYKHNLQFDVASYFNSIYHHDLCNWFQSHDKVSEEDGRGVGQLFRETNAGRSIDFLPQGIYPSKMLGNEFLKFIDKSETLKSDVLVRFMDDFTLFDDDPNVVLRDFNRIQELLGKYALNINPSKTEFDALAPSVEDELTDVKQQLVDIFEEGYEYDMYASGVDPEDFEDWELPSLNDDQISRLLELLRHETLDESDAETILRFIRRHSDESVELVPSLILKFPNLVKHLHSICSDISDKSGLAGAVKEVLKTDDDLLEYQLFWLAAIVEDYLMTEKERGDLLMKIYERTSLMTIARAKVLEIPEQGFGFIDIRDEILRTGRSDWIAWSSAVGSRTLAPSQRNHDLNYFSNGSPMNKIMAEAVKRMPTNQ